MRSTLRLGCLAVLLTFGAEGLAGEASPGGFMKERQAELFSLVKQRAPKKIETAFDSLLDYDALAQQSLRTHWEARSEAERREFTEVLKQLVQRAYRRNLDRTVNYDVSFEGESREADRFLVKTIAKSRKDAREEPISIDYVVRKAGASFRVADIVTEGSSLVNNYNQQFNRIIKKEGFPELIRRMKRKLAEG